MAGLVPAIHAFNALTCARQQMLVTRGLDHAGLSSSQKSCRVFREVMDCRVNPRIKSGDGNDGLRAAANARHPRA
jgi:hypothetical protein